MKKLTKTEKALVNKALKKKIDLVEDLLTGVSLNESSYTITHLYDFLFGRNASAMRSWWRRDAAEAMVYAANAFFAEAGDIYTLDNYPKPHIQIPADNLKINTNIVGKKAETERYINNLWLNKCASDICDYTL